MRKTMHGTTTALPTGQQFDDDNTVKTYETRTIVNNLSVVNRPGGCRRCPAGPAHARTKPRKAIHD
jgi:hypothetical protein